MSELLLVRHARPEIEPAVEPDQWRLSAEGRTASVALAARLDASRPVGRLISSHEIKAIETAVPIAERFAIQPDVDERLGEVRRRWIDGDYRQTAVAWLTDALPPDGWESRQQVVDRWSEALDLYATAMNASIVVGHGLAMTAWLASRSGIDPVAFWSNLGMPDVHIVEGLDDTT